LGGVGKAETTAAIRGGADPPMRQTKIVATATTPAVSATRRLIRPPDDKAGRP
jgi:hypothetical protein